MVMNMKDQVILILDIEINLPFSASLKDKRKVRLGLFDRLKNRYNISISDTGYQDELKFLHCTLAYVSISESNARDMKETLTNEIILFVENHQGQVQISGEFI